MKPGPQILLVDNNPDDVKLVKEIAEIAGLGIHVRSDSASGLEAFHSIQPDLVLIDAKVRETGRADVGQEIHQTERGKSTPIVLISDDTNRPRPATGRPSGFEISEFLARPLAAKSLLSMLARFFPGAFLSSQSENPVGEVATSDDPSLAQHRNASALPSIGSFEEEDLGELLDVVFPSGDSGDLAGALASARAETPSETGTRSTDLGDLLDVVFPSGDSGNLARTLASARTEAPHEATSKPKEAPPAPTQETSEYERFDLEDIASILDAEPPTSGLRAGREPRAGSLAPRTTASLADGALPTGPVPKEAAPFPALALNTTDSVGRASESVVRGPAPELRAPESEVYLEARRQASTRGRRRLTLLVGAGIALVAGTMAFIVFFPGAKDDVARSESAPLADGEIAPSAAPVRDLGEIPLIPTDRSQVDGTLPVQDPAARVPSSPLVTQSPNPGVPGPSPGPAQSSVSRAGSSSDSAPPRTAVPREPRASSTTTTTRSAVTSTDRSGASPSLTTVDSAHSGTGQTNTTRGGESGPDTQGSGPAPGEAAPVPSRTEDREPPAGAKAAGEGRTDTPEGSASASEEAGGPPESADGAEGAGILAQPLPEIARESVASEISAPPAEAPSSEPASEKPFLSPVPLRRPAPPYPQIARPLKLSGVVKVLVKVGADGSVAAVRVVRSVAPALDQAAVAAVKRWKYRPAQFGGRDVEAWIEESIAFNGD